MKLNIQRRLRGSWVAYLARWRAVIIGGSEGVSSQDVQPFFLPLSGGLFGKGGQVGKCSKQNVETELAIVCSPGERQVNGEYWTRAWTRTLCNNTGADLMLWGSRWPGEERLLSEDVDLQVRWTESGNTEGGAWIQGQEGEKHSMTWHSARIMTLA